MRAPVRLIRGRWPHTVEARLKRFTWADPAAVLDDNADPDDFRAAMNAFHLGGTIKITRANRHPDADALLADYVDTTDATIVDIGASDGTTSVDLINRLNGFRQFVIADLHLRVSATRVAGHVVFFDRTDTCVLVAGRRLLAWPSLSRIVRALYAPLIALARLRPRGDTLLLNPAATELMAHDPRISCVEHDIFTPWLGEPVDAIKVANLLRKLYFTDHQIRQALSVLRDNLRDGGHLLIVDNPRDKGVGPRGALYRRNGNHFDVVAMSGGVPEINELIAAVGTAESHVGDEMTTETYDAVQLRMAIAQAHQFWAIGTTA